MKEGNGRERGMKERHEEERKELEEGKEGRRYLVKK